MFFFELGIELGNVLVEHATYAAQSLLHGGQGLPQVVVDDSIEPDQISREAHEISVVLVDEVDELVLEGGRVGLEILQHALQRYATAAIGDEVIDAEVRPRAIERLLAEAQRQVPTTRPR